MPIAKRGLIVRLALVLTILLVTCSLFLFVPLIPVRATLTDLGYPDAGMACIWAPYNTTGSCIHTVGTTKITTYEWGKVHDDESSIYSVRGYVYRNCTDFVAWKLISLGVPTSKVEGLGNGGKWYDNAAKKIGLTRGTTPQVGDAAVIPWNTPGFSPYGHVAYVDKVNQDGTIEIQQSNWDLQGDQDQRTVNPSQVGFTEFVHFGPLMTNPPPPPTNNTVIAVKKLTQSDGTNEVFWAKNTDVFESWWRGNSGINLANLIHISQGDIVGIDVALYSNGEHDLFTATAHNVWETWWYPGQSMHTAEILSNIGNIRKIIKTIGPDGVTNQFYVMTYTGVSEYWWNSGSNGVQGGSIYSLANPVGIYKALEPDGTQALYIADQNYAYMLHWGSGINGIQVTTVINVTAITAISFSEDSDGKHRLYVGASGGGIWEASWYTGGSIGDWYMTGGAPVVALQKWESDSTQVLYEATAGGVFEYWWSQTANTLHAGNIVTGLSSVLAFVRSTDPNGVQSVYTATGTNVLESWWIPGGNGITTGTIA